MPRTLADPDLLHQVFLNLIINAEHACPKGGVLTITVEDIGDAIRLRFTDNGEGMTDEGMIKAFDPFFTTKSHGTGLGLSIVHQILTSHNGKITVRNNDDQPGVTFEMTLPVTGEK